MPEIASMVRPHQRLCHGNEPCRITVEGSPQDARPSETYHPLWDRSVNGMLPSPYLLSRRTKTAGLTISRRPTSNALP